jgi:hypothetical protein
MQITRKHIAVIVGASVISLGLVGGTSFAANAATASITSSVQKPALHGTETPKRTPVPVPSHDAGDDHGRDGTPEHATPEHTTPEHTTPEHATPEPGDDNGHDATDHHGGRVGPDDNNHNRGGDDSGHHGGGHDDGPGHH